MNWWTSLFADDAKLLKKIRNQKHVLKLERIENSNQDGARFGRPNI